MILIPLKILNLFRKWVDEALNRIISDEEKHAIRLELESTYDDEKVKIFLKDQGIYLHPDESLSLPEGWTREISDIPHKRSQIKRWLPRNYRGILYTLLGFWIVVYFLIMYLLAS